MTSSTSKYTQSAQSVQPCLWTAYLELKRENEALREENEALRRREIARGIVELAALQRQLARKTSPKYRVAGFSRPPRRISGTVLPIYPNRRKLSRDFS